jgi:hypothetical protein
MKYTTISMDYGGIVVLGTLLRELRFLAIMLMCL